MSAATAIWYHSGFKFSTSFCSSFKSLRPVSFLQSPTYTPVLFTGFSSKNRVLRPQNSMTELVKISGLSNSSDGGDEGAGILEQEAFISVSSVSMANGLEGALNRLSKWLVAAVLCAIILWRHDAEALWAAMGSVVNSGLSIMLKRILNQARPVSTLRSGPGMPSSHSQSIFFIVIFAILSVVQWLGINELTLFISGLVLAVGSYLSWLRVSQQLHTVSQVVVGAVLGLVLSITWFWSWDEFVHKAYISSIWVRMFVITGAAVFCLSFILYVVRYWFDDRR